MMTEEELVSIVQGAIAKAVEPLQLQIASQKEIISDLREELAELNTRQDTADERVDVIDKGLAYVVTEVERTPLQDFKKQIDHTIACVDSATDTFNSYKASTAVVLEQIKDDAKANQLASAEKQTAFEIKVLGEVNNIKESMDEQVDKTAEDVQMVANQITTHVNNTIDEKVDTVKLEMINLVNKEKLRLNNHVNNSLLCLKGEKGDRGEKGDTGESGFLSGVSEWKTGTIAKENEAYSNDNAIWLCKVKQTAIEPGDNDQWILISDGLKGFDINDGELVGKFASGKTINAGRVSPVHRGVYDAKIKYKRMDIVTIDKSSFLSMRDGNDTRPPSGSGDWLLLSGRGAKGTKGDKGDNATLPMEDLAAVINDTVDSKLEKL